MTRELILKGPHACIYWVDMETSQHWEVQINLAIPRSKEYHQPKDEDFGVWAWTSYTLLRAEAIAREIEAGTRGVRTMQEAPDMEGPTRVWRRPNQAE